MAPIDNLKRIYDLARLTCFEGFTSPDGIVFRRPLADSQDRRQSVLFTWDILSDVDAAWQFAQQSLTPE